MDFPLIGWQRLTLLGDVAVMLPLAVSVAVYLIAARARRTALYWCCWFGGAMIFVVISKLAFIGWGLGIASLDFTGFSGHAARVCAVFPMLGYLMARKKSWRWRCGSVVSAVVLQSTQVKELVCI